MLVLGMVLHIGAWGSGRGRPGRSEGAMGEACWLYSTLA